MQLYAETDIDRAIAEFEAAVCGLFDDPLKRSIALLQSRIAQRRQQHRSTVIQTRELCELMTRQIQRELSA